MSMSWVCPECRKADDYPFYILPCGHTIGINCINRLNSCFCDISIQQAYPNITLGSLLNLVYVPSIHNYKRSVQVLEVNDTKRRDVWEKRCQIFKMIVILLSACAFTLMIILYIMYVDGD